MFSSSEREMVVLRDCSVRMSVLRLLWTLEARGCRVTVADDVLYVTPGSLIGPADAAAIRQYRDELLLLVKYCERVQ